jgi:hypothetical protein
MRHRTVEGPAEQVAPPPLGSVVWWRRLLYSTDTEGADREYLMTRTTAFVKERGLGAIRGYLVNGMEVATDMRQGHHGSCGYGRAECGILPADEGVR